MAAALEGIKVLDFSRLLPGPFATRMLARQGASVTRLELPHWPDPVTRISGLDEELNRGKAKVQLDPRTPEGRKRLLSLVEESDVFVESSRPGLVKKLGLDWESLSAANSKLVYASIPGFPEGHPLRRVAGHDLNFEALAGVLGELDPPSLPPVPIADLAAANRLAFEIAAALFQVQRTGKGKRVEVSLFEAVREWLVFPRAEQEAKGGTPKAGSRWWNGANPFYAIYETKDGKHVAVAALEGNFSDRLLEKLGIQDPRNLGQAFKQKTRDEWAKMLSSEEVCVQPVLSAEEALSSR